MIGRRLFLLRFSTTLLWWLWQQRSQTLLSVRRLELIWIDSVFFKLLWFYSIRHILSHFIWHEDTTCGFVASIRIIRLFRVVIVVRGVLLGSCVLLVLLVIARFEGSGGVWLCIFGLARFDEEVGQEVLVFEGAELLFLLFLFLPALTPIFFLLAVIALTFVIATRVWIHVWNRIINKKESVSCALIHSALSFDHLLFYYQLQPLSINLIYDQWLKDIKTCLNANHSLTPCLLILIWFAVLSHGVQFSILSLEVLLIFILFLHSDPQTHQQNWNTKFNFSLVNCATPPFILLSPEIEH